MAGKHVSVCAHVHADGVAHRAEAVTGLEEGVYVVGTGSTGLHIGFWQRSENGRGWVGFSYICMMVTCD